MSNPIVSTSHTHNSPIFPPPLFFFATSISYSPDLLARGRHLAEIESEMVFRAASMKDGQKGVLFTIESYYKLLDVSCSTSFLFQPTIRRRQRVAFNYSAYGLAKWPKSQITIGVDDKSVQSRRHYIRVEDTTNSIKKRWEWRISTYSCETHRPLMSGG